MTWNSPDRQDQGMASQARESEPQHVRKTANGVASAQSLCAEVAGDEAETVKGCKRQANEYGLHPVDNGESL